MDGRSSLGGGRYDFTFCCAQKLCTGRDVQLQPAPPFSGIHRHQIQYYFYIPTHTQCQARGTHTFQLHTYYNCLCNSQLNPSTFHTTSKKTSFSHFPPSLHSWCIKKRRLSRKQISRTPTSCNFLSHFTSCMQGIQWSVTL